MKQIRISAILPAVRPEWVIAAALEKVEEYEILSASVTEVLQMWSHGIEAELLQNEEQLDLIEDTIQLKGGKKLNVILSGPECRQCHQSGHLMRDCVLNKSTREEGSERVHEELGSCSPDIEVEGVENQTEEVKIKRDEYRR